MVRVRGGERQKRPSGSVVSPPWHSHIHKSRYIVRCATVCPDSARRRILNGDVGHRLVACFQRLPRTQIKQIWSLKKGPTRIKIHYNEKKVMFIENNLFWKGTILPPTPVPPPRVRCIWQCYLYSAISKCRKTPNPRLVLMV